MTEPLLIVGVHHLVDPATRTARCTGVVPDVPEVGPTVLCEDCRIAQVRDGERADPP